MISVKIIVYLLCIITSLACTALLLRSYLRYRMRLLLWGTVCFIGLSINNIALFMDLVIFPQMDFRLIRLFSSLAGVTVLLYGFVWEADD